MLSPSAWIKTSLSYIKEASDLPRIPSTVSLNPAKYSVKADFEIFPTLISSNWNESYKTPSIVAASSFVQPSAYLPRWSAAGMKFSLSRCRLNRRQSHLMRSAHPRSRGHGRRIPKRRLG